MPIATARSADAFVVWEKMSLPLPALFLMFVNVSSMFAPASTASFVSAE